MVGTSRPVDVRALGMRRDYWVLHCTVASAPHSLLVKLAGPDCPFPLDFARTGAVTARAAAAGVPVAKVFASDDSYSAGPWRYLIQEFVAGHEWRHVRPTLSVAGAAAAYAQLADVMVALRSVTFGGFGPLGRDASPTSALNLLSGLEQRAETNVPDKRKAAAFMALLRREIQLFSPAGPASLCHDDLHHRNIIFDGSGDDARLRAVLDWDKAWSGPHESDIARMALWDDMTEPSFWSSYRQRCPPTEGEAHRRLIYQLLWCLEYDVATSRHRSDTERLANRLDVRL
ncbi:MAG: aminoglycoside phosphotransferase family protein [Nocardioidaceae bacterium]